MIRVSISGDFVISKNYNLECSNTSIVDQSILNFLNETDLNIVNLEAPVIAQNSSKVKFGPVLHMGVYCIDLLKTLKVGLVTLANNHIMDHGEPGLLNTLSELSNNEIKYVGAGLNYDEASKPYFFEKNGITIGILNFAENEFSNTHGNEPGASPLDVEENTLMIQKLSKDVDKVIVIIHGGAETHKYPSPRFKKTLDFYAKQGADAIIAHHTHCYNGFDIVGNVPIIYGTGNFIFPVDNSNDFWNIGVICSLKIEKNSPVEIVKIPVKLDYFPKLQLRYLNDQEKKEFTNFENELNEVVKSKELLKQKYEEFSQKVSNQYIHYLQPYSSKYLHKLFSLGVIPNFLKDKKKKMLYLNLIRCEAHREILLKLLGKENN